MSTAIARKPLRQVGSVKELLMNDMAREQLATVAAQHMNPSRLMRVTANAIRTTPKLQECEPVSFLGALMQCAALGLEPNTVLGHAYLVPFRNNKKGITEVQVIIGYKGLIDLARRSGHITSLSANVHYSDDELWDYEEGTDSRLRHRPGPQDGEKIHAYAIARFKDGGHAYVVLPWSQVMKVRDGSQNWQTAVRYNSTDRNPWKTHEDEMAKKTAVRALAKYLPLSVEFMDAVQIDHDGGSHVDYASFAADPEGGPVIDGEVAGENDSEPPANDDPAPKKPAKAPKDETPPPAEKPKPKPPADEKPETKPETDDGGEPEPPQDENTAPALRPGTLKLIDKVQSELTDGCPVNGARQFFAQEIEQVCAVDPAAKAAIEDLFSQFEGDDNE